MNTVVTNPHSSPSLKEVSEGQKITSSIAMTMTLVSFTMLFATLFLGYLAYRFTSEIWPPVGMGRVDLLLPTVSTIIILLSSLSYLLFESTKKAMWLYLTTALGFGFMATQMLFWQGLKSVGIFVDTTVFASMIYAFTWIHAAHVVAGVLGLVTLCFKKTNKIWVNNVGQFWHFLGIIWFVMFLGIFVF